MTMVAQRNDSSCRQSGDKEPSGRNDDINAEGFALPSEVAAKTEHAQAVLADCIESLEKTQTVLKNLSLIRRTPSVIQLTLSVCRLRRHLLHEDAKAIDFDEVADQLVQIACRIDYENQQVIADRMMLDGIVLSIGERR